MSAFYEATANKCRSSDFKYFTKLGTLHHVGIAALGVAVGAARSRDYSE